jgi:hypothetical protein
MQGMIRLNETSSELTFRLGCEHRGRMRNCLRKDGIRLTVEVEGNFAHNVGVSINTFLGQRPDSKITYREAHAELRNLWLLSIEEDPAVGQIRARVANLSKMSVEYLNNRAAQVIPESADEGFLSWAKSADAKRLVEAIRVTCADGAKRVSRSRGGGKRSGERLEPLFFGYACGGSPSSVEGGRPRHYRLDDLVMHLAIDWTIATGSKPLPGRSDHRGFGDLVHCVFQWLHEPAADQALRRYWETVKVHRSRRA